MNQIVSTASTAIGLKSILFYGLIVFVLIIIFFNAIQLSIQQKSLSPLITELGRNFFLANQQLQISSQKIIDEGGIYDSDKSIWSNLWTIINKFSGMFVSLFIIYIWFKILMFLFAHSPISESGRGFTNFILAFFVYYILEVIFILFNSAIHSQVHNIGDLGIILMIPVTSFIVFLKALIIIINPFASKASDALNRLNFNKTIDV